MDLRKVIQTLPRLFHIPLQLSSIKRADINRNLHNLKMTSSSGVSTETYKEAISALNSLQTNAQIRAQLAAQRGSRNLQSLPTMMLYLENIGISKEKLKSLNTIHVAGSKGKGTTCAFTESILRHAGLRTGFYSSPHLSVVRERIQINGVPISEEKFANFFFFVYNRLLPCKEKVEDFTMPAYFRFLTCMAFYAFLEEKVDVAIIEVGIGGRYDCTNVIPNPTAVGITSLGLEHQAILGKTLEEIAYSKAGVMKEKAPTFTVPSHLLSILKLLQDEASLVKCPLFVVPTLDELNVSLKLSVDDGNVSRLNAAVAIQLASSFLSQKFPEKLNLANALDSHQIFRELFPFHISGLESAIWPGRFQVVNVSERLKYYLDGAHTADSLSIALNWFKTSTNAHSFRILIFSLTGDRSGYELLTSFAHSNIFDLALFCPIRRRNTLPSFDNWNILSDGVNLLSECKQQKNYWKTLNNNSVEICDDIDSALEFIRGLCDTKTNYLTQYNRMNNGHPQQINTNLEVLVTGSLHLVGNVLSALNCNEK